MTKRLLLASVFVAAAPVSAAEWTGFYIGAHAGGAWGDVDWANVTNTSPASGIDFYSPDTISQSADGIIGGGHLGYNHQFSNWLIGLEGSWSGLDFDETTANTNAGAGTEEFVYSEVEWLATATARLGWAWQNSVLYLKGGYAAGEVRTSHDDISAGTDAFVGGYSTSDTHGGWTAGAGVEHQIGNSVSVGLEYNYVDLGNQDHSGTILPGPFAIVNDMDVQMHAVTARLNWHFNPL